MRSILARVAALTDLLPRSARDTVGWETPARYAVSKLGGLAEGWRPIIVSLSWRPVRRPPTCSRLAIALVGANHLHAVVSRARARAGAVVFGRQAPALHNMRIRIPYGRSLRLGSIAKLQMGKPT